ncbi:MAG: hypothetical protein BGO14_02205 [Chlamydiales bacterium 38-26]|nr:hypothetical protein [Chlamydiales bacterium]OJV08253.1 MAG: hypothetical protein BGO14_02205 [Chlamydiales bacterium 38-26]
MTGPLNNPITNQTHITPVGTPGSTHPTTQQADPSQGPPQISLAKSQTNSKHIERLKTVGRIFGGVLGIATAIAFTPVVMVLTLLVGGVLAPTGDSINRAIHRRFNIEIPDGSIGLADTVFKLWMESFGKLGSFIKGSTNKTGFQVNPTSNNNPTPNPANPTSFAKVEEAP